MKKIIEEVEDEGLVALLGKEVELWCECYIYTGTLVGVNTEDVLLENAKIVYETGPLDIAGFKDVQSFSRSRYVRISKIENYGEVL